MTSQSFGGVIIPLLLSAVTVLGQEPLPVTPAQRAWQEVEGVYMEAKDLSDKRAAITIQAKVANLLWSHDRARARAIFQQLWEEVGQVNEINHEVARTEILSNLFPRDPALAWRWLEDVTAGQQSHSAPFQAQIGGTDPNLRRLADLASQFIEDNPTLAAALLERHLSVSVSPVAFNALIQLRQKDSRLADYLLMRTLESLGKRPTVVALPAVYLLVDYVFPDPQSVDTLIGLPDASLQMYYFSTAYELLQKSLEELESQLRKEQGYSEKDLRFRSLFQGQVAAVLSALAPRLAPARAEELKKLAARLAAKLPPEMNPMLDPAVARLHQSPYEGASTETALSIALARGDLQEAKRLVDKVQDVTVKKVFSQALIQSEVRAHLARSHFADALMAARGIEDVHLRATLYARIAKAASQKGEKELARLVLMEAQMFLSGTRDQEGVRTWVILSLVSDASVISDSLPVQFLWSAVPLLNSLIGASGNRSEDDSLMLDVLHQLAPELWRAFASVGQVNFDEALLAAHQIRDHPLRLLARLAACEGWLNDANAERNRPKQ